jgi:cysteine desulfuration protein SufE
MTINEIQDEIIEEFSVYDDWMDKYQFIIDISRELTPLDNKFKLPQNLIKGCQSNVWLNAELVDGVVVYSADSDALITKGIASLLIKVLSGHTADEILKSDLYFIEQIGLKENLSPTRSNGLLAMIKQMKVYAMAYQHKQQANI